MKNFCALCLSDVIFTMLINVKMPTIGILTLKSRVNFLLSLSEHGKSFITSGLALDESTVRKKEKIRNTYNQIPQS